MTTATLRLSTPLPVAREATKKGWLGRFYNRLLEARMRAAMREINMRRHLIPEDVLKKSGYQASVNNDSAYPFTR